MLTTDALTRSYTSTTSSRRLPGVRLRSVAADGVRPPSPRATTRAAGTRSRRKTAEGRGGRMMPPELPGRTSALPDVAAVRAVVQDTPKFGPPGPDAERAEGPEVPGIPG